MDILKEECCICLEKNMAQEGKPGQFNSIRLTCCGGCFCCSCVDQFNTKEEETGVPWDCPLCRAPQAFGKEDIDRAMKKAKEGKGWAQEWIGQRYYTGDDVPQSFTKAFEFFSLAAAQGQPNAQNWLGTMYLLGEGVKQSHEKASQFYKQAAYQGLPNAFGSLGNCYQNGYGVEKSLEKAFEMFSLGVERGCISAFFDVGLCYLDGKVVKKDYEKAIHFFTMGAEKGHKNSQCQLADCYRYGKGDNPNKEMCAIAQKNLDALLLYYSQFCAQCGKSEGKFTLKCSRCLSVYYCNSVCQAKHWKEGGHKADCNIYKKVY